MTSTYYYALRVICTRPASAIFKLFIYLYYELLRVLRLVEWIDDDWSSTHAKMFYLSWSDVQSKSVKTRTLCVVFKPQRRASRMWKDGLGPSEISTTHDCDHLERGVMPGGDRTLHCNSPVNQLSIKRLLTGKKLIDWTCILSPKAKAYYCPCSLMFALLIDMS